MENRHPVDELAEIRAERRKLAEHEEALRVRLLRSNADLVGQDYEARVQIFERMELNRSALEARFGTAQVRACEQVVAHRIISLTKRPPRRQKAPAPHDPHHPPALRPGMEDSGEGMPGDGPAAD
jgi:hypothetical protein